MNFQDKHGRVIALRFNDEGYLLARYNGQQIGKFEFRIDDDDPTETWELWHMQMEAPFQKSGIGAKIMAFAVKELGWFNLPKPIYFVNAPNYLSEEGAALVNHCFRNGILPSDFHKQYEQ